VRLCPECSCRSDRRRTSTRSSPARPRVAQRRQPARGCPVPSECAGHERCRSQRPYPKRRRTRAETVTIDASTEDARTDRPGRTSTATETATPTTWPEVPVEAAKPTPLAACQSSAPLTWVLVERWIHVSVSQIPPDSKIVRQATSRYGSLPTWAERAERSFAGE
jgi:hypothetical protein